MLEGAKRSVPLTFSRRERALVGFGARRLFYSFLNSVWGRAFSRLHFAQWRLGDRGAEIQSPVWFKEAKPLGGLKTAKDAAAALHHPFGCAACRLSIPHRGKLPDTEPRTRLSSAKCQARRMLGTRLSDTYLLMNKGVAPRLRSRVPRAKGHGACRLANWPGPRIDSLRVQSFLACASSSVSIPTRTGSVARVSLVIRHSAKAACTRANTAKDRLEGVLQEIGKATGEERRAFTIKRGPWREIASPLLPRQAKPGKDYH
jgi:hypothetical protein